MSSEVEYKGIKIKGSKLLLLLPLLGTLGGVLWGGFEFYKDYMNMRDKINEYVAPDLSSFTIKLNVFEERVVALEEILNTKIANMEVLLTTELDKATQLVRSAQEDARSIRTDMRKDLMEIQDNIGAVDRRSRNSETEVREALRTAESDIRSLIDHANDRFDSKRTAIESDFTRRMENVDVKLKELEERLRQMLERALNNPLSGS
jgi:hypothetical protein